VALSCLAAGAGAVHVSEPNDARRAHAARLGLTRVIDPAEGDVTIQLSEDTPGGVDVAIECAGNARALDACLAAIAPGGTIVQTALHPKPVEIDPQRLTQRDVTLKGVVCFPVTSWPRVIRLIASGRLPAERIVTGEVALDHAIKEGFEALLDPQGTHVKVLVAAG
jgi:(R,R)-butanediol dehydrogenase/meso-butanediol dehydrogenase/diacetyl reductase